MAVNVIYVCLAIYVYYIICLPIYVEQVGGLDGLGVCAGVACVRAEVAEVAAD
jgi:hypothetical protein